MSQRRKGVILLALSVTVVGLLVGGGFAVRHKHLSQRAAWKTSALTQLAGFSHTNEDVARELEDLKAHRGAGERQWWAGDRVLLMTNNEFLIYAFRHGLNDGPVDHLLLAHGSDGRWYYSTYHFCNSMAGVMSDDAPGSLAEFASRYSAREFDGKSDVCLQHTWPDNR